MNLKGVPLYPMIWSQLVIHTQNTILHEITIVDRVGGKDLKAYEFDEICGELAELRRKGLQIKGDVKKKYHSIHTTKQE